MALRRSRQALPRRIRQPLVLQYRSRAYGDRRRGRRADEAARGVVDLRQLRHTSRARARGRARGALVARRREDLPHLRRRRRDRYGGEARAHVLAGARAAGPPSHRQSHQRVSRDDGLRNLDRWHRGRQDGLRPARAEHLAGRVGLAGGACRGARADRPRTGCGLLLRARDRCRRRLPATPGVHRTHGRDLPRCGRALRLRLGDLRLRTARHVVRLRALRDRAGSRHVREGRDQRLPPARGRGRLGSGRRAVLE